MCVRNLKNRTRKTHMCVCDWNFGKMHTCVRCACGQKSSVRMCVRARQKIVATHSLVIILKGPKVVNETTDLAKKNSSQHAEHGENWRVKENCPSCIFVKIEVSLENAQFNICCSKWTLTEKRLLWNSAKGYARRLRMLVEKKSQQWRTCSSSLWPKCT